ncbi:MAG: CTP synthase, partial [Nanoarchaeota archaeon]|nr:CTP synthase [Nanoarchaeota archaeon]
MQKSEKPQKEAKDTKQKGTQESKEAKKETNKANQKRQNFIFITGGVISSVGKGILTSSLAALIEAQGYTVTAMKIDPYINIDAGTMRPTEHGEVFVTDDGFETDQDLGNYERFTHCILSKDHSITTGQVYLQVIKDEREGKYFGKCVEVIPHIPLEIIRRIKHVASETQADFVFIEIGATAGEYQIFPFLDAARRMKFKGDTVVFVHIGYLPIPNKIGEQKTKPLQRSIFDLLSVGIKPDFVVGRSEKPMDNERKEKIALNCSVAREHVISAEDLDLIYDVPVNFHNQGFDKNVLAKFGLPYKENNGFKKWTEKIQKIKNLKKEVT